MSLVMLLQSTFTTVGFVALWTVVFPCERIEHAKNVEWLSFSCNFEVAGCTVGDFTLKTQ